MHIEIRSLQKTDTEEIKWLHYRAVHSICSGDYTQEQLEAWAPAKRRVSDWAEVLRRTDGYVALADQRIIAFATSNKRGWLTKLYTHPEYQGMGTGSALLARMESHTRERGFEELLLESSASARTFYQRHGFECLGLHLNPLTDPPLKDYIMRKSL
jgi:putative acetyltransferase